MNWEAEHTPAPWRVCQVSNFGNGYIYTTIQPENPDPETMRHLLMASGQYDVCHMMHTPLHRKAELHRANAEFIVASVNSYASSQAEISRLREALERARERLATMSLGSRGDTKIKELGLNEIDEALSEAS